VNDPLSDLVKFPSCIIKHNTPIEMQDFLGLHEKTRQQTHLRVQRYRQNKDRTAASPIVQTLHNEGTITQQSSTPKLFITSIQPTRTRVNFFLCVMFYEPEICSGFGRYTKLYRKVCH
jgi:hypothetical protein